MLRFLIGKVDKTEDNHKVIAYCDDFMPGVPIPCTPMVKLSKYPEKNDRIIIIQPDDGVEVFLYFMMEQVGNEDCVSIQYKDNIIKLSNSEININTGETGSLNINSNGGITMKAPMVTVDGNLSSTHGYTGVIPCGSFAVSVVGGIITGVV